MGVRSLGQEGPLEEGKATHSSILAWRIPWTEKPGGLQSIASQRVGHGWSNWACMHMIHGSDKWHPLPWKSETMATHCPEGLGWFCFVLFCFLISCRLITLQYCSGFCNTLTWISHGFTCVPHPDPPSHLPPHPLPLGLGLTQSFLNLLSL